MSKRPKGLSMEEKCDRAHDYIQKSRTFFHMKELEKSLPKAKGMGHIFIYTLKIKKNLKNSFEKNLKKSSKQKYKNKTNKKSTKKNHKKNKKKIKKKT